MVHVSLVAMRAVEMALILQAEFKSAGGLPAPVHPKLGHLKDHLKKRGIGLVVAYA